MSPAVGIRLVFAGTVAVFAVQLFIIAGKIEPYPALTMPAFNGHPLEANVVVVEKPEFRVQFADAQAEVVRYDDLLPQTPLDGLSIFKNAFSFYELAIDQDVHVGPGTAALFAVFVLALSGTTWFVTSSTPVAGAVSGVLIVLTGAATGIGYLVRQVVLGVRVSATRRNRPTAPT